MDAIPIKERISCTVRDATQLCGVSRSRLYELLRDGKLQGKVVAGRRVILVDSLLKFIGDSPSAKRETAA